MTIHDLDDDSLLHIFYLFRPSLLEVYESGETSWNWDDQHWWYKLVQVCRRWRRLILGSASHLRLRLVCKHGTPVADMLAHSPPFPLIIGFYQPNDELTAEDEEGIMLALRLRDRVRFIYLHVTVPSLKKLLPVMDDQFPALEFLHIAPPAKHNTHFTLSPTFEAPHLRILWLSHFAPAISSPLLSTATGLVVLSIDWIHPSTYPHPNNYLQLLSLLPHLEANYLSFCSSVPNHDIESQMSQAPITIHVVHPNLRLFNFKGVSGFLEAILPYMTAPLLEMFTVQFFNQLHFSVPHLATFMTNTEKLRPSRVVFILHHEAVVLLSYTTAASGYWLSNFEVTISGRHLDWQVASATQISNVLRPLFSEVVDLTLDYREHTLSSEWHNQANRTDWREVLGSFRNVKMLRVHNGLIGEVSRSLTLDGEPPLDVLPELTELVCPVGSLDGKTFSAFLREREATGRPVHLIGAPLPVGRTSYNFFSSAGTIHIPPDPITSS